MDPSPLNDEDVDSAKAVAETRLRERAEEVVAKAIVTTLSTLDMVVFASCGGDPQRLLAEAIIDSTCLSLDQNPIDLLGHYSKNSSKSEEGNSDDFRS